MSELSGHHCCPVMSEDIALLIAENQRLTTLVAHHAKAGCEGCADGLKPALTEPPPSSVLWTLLQWLEHKPSCNLNLRMPTVPEDCSCGLHGLRKAVGGR